MESTRKRKASNATPSSADGSASKKLRLLNSSHPTTAKSNVHEVGTKIVQQLRNAQDKSGRPIATEFLELPDPDELPEYYETIQQPVAIDTIEEKLNNNEYPTIITIESDLKLMINNAKLFNSPGSVIFDDAERIRKLVFNFMKVHNPAYKEIPGYTAFPTPLPDSKAAAPTQNGTREGESEEDVTVAGQRQSIEKPRRATTETGSEAPERKSSVAPSATTGDGDRGGSIGEGDLDFTGKTFQEAQQMMISYFLRYTDEDGLDIYQPFGNLPSRKIEDYYKIIRHPVSLKSIAKQTRGIHGRTEPTGVSDFKTWDAFEEEVSFIWRNAQEYNEDGSAMFNLAADFEEHFKSLLAEAKEKIEEPSGPRLKIGGPKPKVMLNLSQHRNSPTPGVTVDNEALARQRQMVQAGVNGNQLAARPAPTANGVASTADAVRPSSSAQSGSPLPNNVKLEKASTGSPAPTAPIAALTNGMMPPPPLRPMSGSPYPQQQQSAVNSFHYTAPASLPPTPLRTYPRENALMPLVTINTHPQLKIPKVWNMSIPPHPTLSHQSLTTTLPNTHYFLQISGTISKELNSGRAYKIFVTVNGTRLMHRDTQQHSETGRRTHVYEGSLAQGVNRIEVEVAAATLDEKKLDVEKVTVYANLMR